MKITFDRFLAILSILLAIPALIEFIHNENIRDGVLFSALVVLVSGYWLYRRWENGQPFFTHLEIHKTLIFQDRDADVAVLETKTKTKANHPVQQIWFRNISADGDIRNFTIDGSPPLVVQRKAGSWEICKQFEHPLERGDKVEITLRYELYRAFTGHVEGVTHVLATKTKKLLVRVQFHENKVGRDIRAFVGLGADKEKALAMPTPSANGTGYELEIENPKKGSYYTIEWRW